MDAETEVVEGTTDTGFDDNIINVAQKTGDKSQAQLFSVYTTQFWIFKFSKIIFSFIQISFVYKKIVGPGTIDGITNTSTIQAESSNIGTYIFKV